MLCHLSTLLEIARHFTKETPVKHRLLYASIDIYLTVTYIPKLLFPLPQDSWHCNVNIVIEEILLQIDFLSISESAEENSPYTHNWSHQNNDPFQVHCLIHVLCSAIVMSHTIKETCCGKVHKALRLFGNCNTKCLFS